MCVFVCVCVLCWCLFGCQLVDKISHQNKQRLHTYTPTHTPTHSLHGGRVRWPLTASLTQHLLPWLLLSIAASVRSPSFFEGFSIFKSDAAEIRNICIKHLLWRCVWSSSKVCNTQRNNEIREGIRVWWRWVSTLSKRLFWGDTVIPKGHLSNLWT